MSHKRNNRNKSKQRKPPSLADIVREKTNDGEVIVDFYLDVVRGKLDDEGFEVCHKLEAAEQVHAIAPGLVAEYIAQLTGIECNHAIRRRRTRPTTVVPAESLAPEQSGAGTHPRPDSNNANSARARHQALEYLASALAAPSLADDPRVAGIVRGSTDHGKTVVSFLLHVMHGVVRGFRPRHRVQAASELLGHIARDELARSGSLLTEPALNAVEGTKIVRPEPVEGPGPSVIPAKAGIQVGGDEEGLPSEPTQADDQEDPDTERGAYDIQGDPTVIPAKSLPRTRYGAGIQVDPTVIPAEAGIQDGGDGEGLPSDHPEADDQEDPDTGRGSYDIDRKIADAQHDPAHPIHKFVQAYDEVAETFHAKDNDNDNDDEVRYWISGEVRDAYGKYIWEYAPAHPKSIRRRLRPKRRRSTPKGESVWVKSEIDKRREAGIPPPKRTLIWV